VVSSEISGVENNWSNASIEPRQFRPPASLSLAKNGISAEHAGIDQDAGVSDVDP
jgi:hypothetical protein